MSLVCATIAAAAMGMLTSGCSTVVFSQNQTEERNAAIERDALVIAASAISETKWPQPRSASWATRLTGGSSDANSVSKGDAVGAYVKSLGAPPGRQTILFSDAARHLDAANALVDAASLAAESIRPLMADVSVVEGAIGELRESRDIYLASLRELAHEGEAVNSVEVHALKAEFNEAIEAVGEAADLLAAKVSRDRTETVARSSERLDLNGSL